MNGKQKPSNSMFVGTHPQCDLAIKTLCFGIKKGKQCNVKIQGKTFKILTVEYFKQDPPLDYKQDPLGTGHISTAYPVY